MAVPEKFTGYGSLSRDNWKDLRKPFESNDVDIQVQYCGVCGSDLHTLSGGWGGTIYPSVVGHEIVGVARRVGSAVTQVRVGSVVGVGPNAWSCGHCAACKADKEQYCTDLVETYNFQYSDGSRSWGGYADFVRVHERFVFPVPASIPPALAAPLFCAGLTVFSPLTQAGVRPGTRVGVVGLGGLGHYAVLFAKAMGAAVTVVSHSERKREDARALGADAFLVSSSRTGWAAPAARSLDLVVCTSFARDMPLADYLSLLDVGGSLTYVGIPEANLPALPPTLMIGNNAAIRGSNTGSRKEVLAMLDLVAAKGLQGWVEEMPMSQCAEAIQRQSKGESRYRFVLKRDW